MENKIVNLQALQVPDKVRDGLAAFLGEVLELYGGNLVSIVAFGSAVSGGYVQGASDLNLFVIHADLNIVDLDKVAALAKRWADKRGFAPRFLSVRNLEGAKRVFPLDFLAVRDARAVLYGSDPFADLTFDRAALRCQLSFQLKGMRMKVKQQYWRAAGNKAALRRVLERRAASLVHLARGMVFLKTGRIPGPATAVFNEASAEFGVSKEALVRLTALRAGTRADGPALRALFQDLMEIVRTLDDAADGVQV